ncbi:MAG TPA: hypothetical protein VK483_02260 [Chitinophagaceae bacterium]|nr:hypothetical protein [Chitinophagaceae bacterium]
MRKTIVILSFFVSLTGTDMFAQVQIQTTLPTVGLVQKNQLWNLVLLNSSNSLLYGRLELVLFDRQTSQELMTASTAEFSLVKGSVIINVNNLSPVQYNYIGIAPDKNINTLLPVGAYSVCYTFVRDPNTDKREILAEECVSFDVEPLSPPMLSFPADSSVLETAPTQFSWTPPTPAVLLNRLHYEVLITEVQSSQKAAEALEENIPFFSNDQAPNNFMTYPAAQPAFEKDKWYAWQVIARDDNNYAGKSEVWVFKVAKQNPVQAIINGTAYVQLQKNGSEKTIAPNGNLRFYYFNQLADTAAVVTVTDLTEKTKKDDVVFTIPLARGQNFIQKDISKIIRWEEGHVYKWQLQNSAMEKWNIMFEIKKYKE